MLLARKLARVLRLCCGELARPADLQRNTLRIKAGAFSSRTKDPQPCRRAYLRALARP
jgi:hypothetical protein